MASHDRKLERLFDASPEVVFGGFTGLQAPKELYADAPGWIVESECDLRVGPMDDRIRASANPAGPRNQRVPGGRLTAAPGLPVGDDDAGRLQRGHGMEVTCREHDGRTRMLIKQGGFPTAGVWDEFAGGWASILDGLGRAVAARVTDRS